MNSSQLQKIANEGMEQLNNENSRTVAQNHQAKQKSMEVQQASKRDLPEPHTKQEQVPAISAAQIISNVYANIDQIKDETKTETPTLKQKSPSKNK